MRRAIRCHRRQRYVVSGGFSLIAWRHGATGSLASRKRRVSRSSPQQIATPAAANSAQPQLSVSKRGVLLSWIERTGDLATLKFAERTASGWTAARTIASGRDWFVNWADVPSALRLPSGAIVAHWLQKSGASHLRLRRAAVAIPPMTARRGRRRFCRITTARRPSTGLRRCSRSVTASAWSGSTAAR